MRHRPAKNTVLLENRESREGLQPIFFDTQIFVGLKCRRLKEMMGSQNPSSLKIIAGDLCLGKLAVQALLLSNPNN
jgi:hypothetical protein